MSVWRAASASLYIGGTSGSILTVHFTHPIPFDIPDSVWLAAGANGWQPAQQCYVASAYRDALSGKPHGDLAADSVPLELIVPPVRNGGATWFVEERLLRALHGMVAGKPIPAVLGQRPNDDPATRVEIVDGMHRFYASTALGFTHLPIAIRPYWKP